MNNVITLKACTVCRKPLSPTIATHLCTSPVCRTRWNAYLEPRCGEPRFEPRNQYERREDLHHVKRAELDYGARHKVLGRGRFIWPDEIGRAS